jgi:hypothetical protein
MDEQRSSTQRTVQQAPLVWRSTLRGVLILDDELLLLEGLGAAIWLALDDGPRSEGELFAALEAWGLGVDPDAVGDAVDRMIEAGLVRA